jgi:predicted DNA-binding transcriptional regulator AlpA
MTTETRDWLAEIVDAETQAPFFRKPTVRRLACDVDDSTLWRWEQVGKFPKRIRISARLTVWNSAEVLQWVNERREGRG